jgi:hypothetical protein
MTDRALTFRDQIKLSEKPVLFSDSLNLLEDIFSGENSSKDRVVLRARIRATHSGYLLNSRVYPGVFMERSTGTWTSVERGGTASYNKPVILNHDQRDATQIIGRVHGAIFTRLKGGDDFLRDFKNPSTGRDHGSGYITLDTLINDPDAMIKIVDGRYSTVSTGQRPSEARCSICGFDWMKFDPWESDSAEPCEHIPGKTYQIDDNEFVCYIITGDLDYQEVSYVTIPAQPNAKTIATNFESLSAFASRDSRGQELFFNTFDESGALNKISLLDSNGHFLDLEVKEGEKDQIPDIAAEFTRTSVSVPNLEDKNMDRKQTTDEADNVLDSWIKDASVKAENARSEQTEEEKVVSEEVTDTEEIKEDTEEEVQASEEDSEAQVKITELEDENKALQEERDALKEEVGKLQSIADSLTDEVVRMKQTIVGDAARTLALIRAISSEQDEILDNRESFDEYVNELSKRSIDSLSDAISDSLPGLQKSLKNIKKNSPVNIQKVEDPTLRKTEENSANNDGSDESHNELIHKDDYLGSF